MDYLKFLINNWYVIFVFMILTVFITNILVKWMSKPTNAQVSDIKEWLKFAVAQAEKQFGSGTGELKLRCVYDQALKAFPWVGVFISFDKFKGWVSEALDWLEGRLEENDSIAGYVINK